MPLKKGPYLLIFILVIILIFILGVRYGQQVEMTNKKINFYLSLAPTKPPQPTPPTLGFKTYSNKICGIEFTYPSFYRVEESSGSAVFKNEKNIHQMTIDCRPSNKLLDALNDPKLTTREAVFKGKKIEIKTASQLPDFYQFQVVNPLNIKHIYIGINKSLYPLFESSLQFK